MYQNFLILLGAALLPASALLVYAGFYYGPEMLATGILGLFSGVLFITAQR